MTQGEMKQLVAILSCTGTKQPHEDKSYDKSYGGRSWGSSSYDNYGSGNGTATE